MSSMGIYQREGRWYVRWRREGRLVRKSLGGGIKTRAQAEAVWCQLERKRLEGKLALLDPSQTPLGDFARQYLEERQGQLAESSVDRYRVAFKVLADDLGEKIMLRPQNSTVGQHAPCQGDIPGRSKRGFAPYQGGSSQSRQMGFDRESPRNRNAQDSEAATQAHTAGATRRNPER